MTRVYEETDLVNLRNQNVLTGEASLLALVSTVGGLTIATVGVITFFYEWRKSRLASLNEVYRLLGDITHREARKVLYGNETNASYEILGLPRDDNNLISSENLMSLAKDIVRSDLNHVGTLIQYKLVSKGIIVKEYSWMIVKCWKLLEGEIMNRRNSKDGNPNYMKNFEDLKNEAVKHKDKQSKLKS